MKGVNFDWVNFSHESDEIQVANYTPNDGVVIHYTPKSLYWLFPTRCGDSGVVFRILLTRTCLDRSVKCAYGGAAKSRGGVLVAPTLSQQEPEDAPTLS
jgi:hypothetical protein